MTRFSSLTAKITAFYLTLIALYFLINLAITIIYINNEQREDVEILLSHALSESLEYVRGERHGGVNLDFLYDIPHMTSVLKKIGAKDIEFFYSSEKYHAKSGEIAASKLIHSGSYLNLKSSDSEIRAHIMDTAITIFFQHLAYLVVVGVLGVYFINRLLSPLNHLAEQCKNYKDGNEFYLASKNTGSEIVQIKTALNALVARFEGFRKKDKEMVAAATHELKTPLAIIKARVEKFETSKNYTKSAFIAEINEDIKRLYLEIKGILYFNIFDYDEKSEFSVRSEILAAIAKVDLLLKNNKLLVQIKGEDFMVTARKNLFAKMFMSILENAIQYAARGTTIDISLENKTLRIKNAQGGSANLFSSKLGTKILEKIATELDFTFEIHKDSEDYEVSICFN